MPSDERTGAILGLSYSTRPQRLRSGALISKRYEGLGCLGHGGYGTVCRVLDLEIGREVAAKLLDQERESPSGIARPRTSTVYESGLLHKTASFS
jgi:serine/threonine protein kinase